MIDIDFKILVFLAAAEHLNFTRAAKEMNISQPAVSKSIHALESQLGHTLFNRVGHGLTLTERAMSFHTYALQIKALYQEMNCAISMIDGLPSGELRVGASTTLSHYILPEILAAFHTAYPSIILKMFHGNSRKIEELLQENRIDLGLTEGLSDNTSIKYDTFVKDEIVLVTRPDNPVLNKHGNITKDQLTELEYVFREQGSGTNDIIYRALLGSGIDWRLLQVNVYLASTESIKNFLLKTNCFAFLSIHAVSREVANGELLAIDVQGLDIQRNFFFLQPYGITGRLAEIFRRFSYLNFEKNGQFHRKENL